MALPIITDHFYVQATFQRSDNDVAVNTFCFRNHRDIPGESSTDPALLESLRDLLDSFYGTRTSSENNAGSLLSDRCFGLKYVIYDLGQPDAGASEIDSATFATTGSSGGTVLPPDCAIVITWRTAQRGRSYRGRTYLGPLRQATLAADGTINTTQAGRILEVAPLLIGSPASRDWELCVLSRVQGVATPVTRGDVDLEFDTQRRRGLMSAPRLSFAAP